MISVTVDDLKLFMNALLAGDSFDPFLLTEGSVTTCLTYFIDGHYRSGYFDQEVRENPPEYVPWEYVRPHIFDMIRGRRKPLKMRFIFRAPEDAVERLVRESGAALTAGDVAGLYINLTYETGTVSVTTGVSLRVFSADRTLEHAWDESVRELFRRLDLAVTDQL